MDNSWEYSVDERALGHGVYLCAVEKCAEGMETELVRAHVEPTRVRAYQRLIPETRTSEMICSVVGSIVCHVYGIDVPLIPRIRCLADGDLNVCSGVGSY